MVGPWGEDSKDLQNLVEILGETKLAARAMAMGREVSDIELGVISS